MTNSFTSTDTYPQGEWAPVVIRVLIDVHCLPDYVPSSAPSYEKAVRTLLLAGMIQRGLHSDWETTSRGAAHLKALGQMRYPGSYKVERPNVEPPPAHQQRDYDSQFTQDVDRVVAPHRALARDVAHIYKVLAELRADVERLKDQASGHVS